MKIAKCPQKKNCFDYGDCEGCAIGKYVAATEKKIDRLKNRPKARWVNTNTGTTFKCSKCGEEPMYAPHKGMCFVTLTKFCPNCGAEMDLTDYDDKEDGDARRVL